MSRQYYGGAEPVDQLHPNRALPLSMPQSIRESPRSFPLSRPQNRSSPVADSESEKGSNSRKRIGLACARCRKRKIKCSGDQGQGICQNCKGAGLEPESCQFLRVNSDPMSMNQPQLSWNYQPSGLSRNSSAISSLSAMTAPSSYSGSSIAATSYPSSSSFVRPMPMNSHPTSSYASGSRQSYPLNYAGFSDELPDSYGMNGLPSTQYNIQGQDSHLPSVNYNPADMSRSWTSIPNSRQLNQNFTLEPDGSSRFPNPSFPFPSAPPSTQANLIPSEPTRFPAMNTLKGSLPSYDFNNRILPALGSKGSAGKSVRSASMASTDTTGLSIPTYRSSVCGNIDHNGNDGNQHSAASSTSSTFSHTEGPGSNSSSSPQMSQRSTAFAYHHGQHDRESTYGPTYLPTNAGLVDRHTGLENHGLDAVLSHDQMLSGRDSSSHQYTYNLGSSTKHAQGTLVNGENYVNLHEPQHTQSIDNSNQLSHPATFHRSSISTARPN